MSKRNQRGAISLYTLLAVMFFMTFMIGVYKIVSSKNNSQLSSLQYVQKQYFKDACTDYIKRISKFPSSSMEQNTNNNIFLSNLVQQNNKSKVSVWKNIIQC